MAYRVREIFFSLQGEGAYSGRPAVFCRMQFCNLWSGVEEDRSRAICRFCDTDFRGGSEYPDAASLADAVARLWPDRSRPYVVLTGGEPALQVDAPLVGELHARGCELAIETNGTRQLPEGLDWVTVSPKAGTRLRVARGDELKLVYPQAGLAPEDVEHLDFGRFYLQPMDGPDRQANTRAAVAYCLAHPRWSLSLQAHKILGLR